MDLLKEKKKTEVNIHRKIRTILNSAVSFTSKIQKQKMLSSSDYTSIRIILDGNIGLDAILYSNRDFY